MAEGLACFILKIKCSPVGKYSKTNEQKSLFVWQDYCSLVAIIATKNPVTATASKETDVDCNGIEFEFEMRIRLAIVNTCPLAL